MTDYSLKAGDRVYNRNWGMNYVEVVDINWALKAAAVRLFTMDGKPGGIIVWPVESLDRLDVRLDPAVPPWGKKP